MREHGQILDGQEQRYNASLNQWVMEKEELEFTKRAYQKQIREVQEQLFDKQSMAVEIRKQFLTYKWGVSTNSIIIIIIIIID
ncbi:hypothetical protein CBR_g19732 [Chara braunii]|uniref:Uncharacterized protein n=1 Tax=Chara braunii TaxID=69332 RepID=A0A388JTR0_CHABU|nr:hypothetical protein CBR_g19732 [Chara braunii]|eukprot:GBG61199.1 hypothetical protein CBR_g19732 [Chara braunii]